VSYPAPRFKTVRRTPLKPGDVEASHILPEKLEREVEETKHAPLGLLKQNKETPVGDV
jgi:hypothetical protein